MTFSIPAHKCGLVIGRGGENVKSINQQTGAFVEISRQPPPNGDPNFKLFTIRGSPQQIDHAKQLIEDKIEVGAQPGAVRHSQYHSQCHATPSATPLPVAWCWPPSDPLVSVCRVLCVLWVRVQVVQVVQGDRWVLTTPTPTTQAPRPAPRSEYKESSLGLHRSLVFQC